MAFLEHKDRFDVKNVRAKSKITEGQLFRWTGSNFFRTSYGDMSNKVRLFICSAQWRRAAQLSLATRDSSPE